MSRLCCARRLFRAECWAPRASFVSSENSRRILLTDLRYRIDLCAHFTPPVAVRALWEGAPRCFQPSTPINPPRTRSLLHCLLRARLPSHATNSSPQTSLVMAPGTDNLPRDRCAHAELLVDPRGRHRPAS